MAGSEELVNLGLFADRCGAYRMLATEGIYTLLILVLFFFLINNVRLEFFYCLVSLLTTCCTIQVIFITECCVMCYRIVNEFSFNLATLGGLNNIINLEYISLSLCSYGRTNTNISLSTPPPRLFMDNL